MAGIPKVHKVKRENKLQISFTDDEYNKLAQEAYEKNMHMAEYVRYVLEWRRTLMQKWNRKRESL